MYIGFLGAPSSGKTTTAARVFAELKESGLVVEFLSEQARMYIAALRKASFFFKLEDSDQIAIMKQQNYWEEILESSIRENDGILITDSCSLNSLFYMTEPPEYWTVDYYQRKDALLYYAPPLPLFQREDPLRIHNKAESAIIEDKIRDFVNTNSHKLNIRHLDGSLRMRANVVIRDAFDLLATSVADSLNETVKL